jgi:hypothetical protein
VDGTAEVVVLGGAPAVAGLDDVGWVGGVVVVVLRLEDDAPGSEPRLMLDGLVWKLRTPTRPATVASIKIGARLITSSGFGAS